ncbi:GNAT family N-acetyltransferase [Sphingomonas sp. NBWT7]|uniref:GNAT family N-acetyltransferase n=1 Tax=Sphingomonas sp. NBWT7 TaxID=2596913 RepID=UPI0016270349|nr:GNAT family N-acetyltransferase [Sphingomonas sp. NBWT7]QNE32537.1 GNAT family N-acetyltransferase [Sphingomonas sp. NBWT7]
MSSAARSIDIRPLAATDLGAAVAIQDATYPAFLREPATAFASRLALGASYCFAAHIDGVLAGYLLAHGWQREAPPPIGAALIDDGARDVLFIHDLAVASAGRGTGIGRALVAQGITAAAVDGITAAELIAVEGASAFWAMLGFAQAPTSPALAAKVADYGPHARWMTRAIGLTSQPDGLA